MFFRFIGLFLPLLIAFATENKQKEIYFLNGQIQEIKTLQDLSEKAQQKSGFFVGGSVGNSVFSLRHNPQIKLYPVLLGMLGGYQKFSHNAGFRTYLEYFASADVSNDMQYFYHNLAFNIDFLRDIMLEQKYGIDFFGGLGFGHHLFVGKHKLEKIQDMDFEMFANLGVGAILDIKHRIELHLKIPLTRGFNANLNYAYTYFVSYYYNF